LSVIAFEEADDGGCPLVGVDLGVGEPGAVVDDRVHVVDAVTVAAVLARTVAGDPVAGPLEAGVLACVHVQQVAGARPLVAAGRLPLDSRRPRKPRPSEHLPDGGMGEAGRAGDQPRPPAGLAAAGTDPLGELGRQLLGRTAWPARTIEQARQRRPCFLVSFLPAVPPAMRRRRRDAEAGRGLLQRHSLGDGGNERETASESELRVTVQRHPGSSFEYRSLARPTASKEGRIEPSAVHNLCRHVT
jgi:hypothetical protein